MHVYELIMNDKELSAPAITWSFGDAFVKSD